MSYEPLDFASLSDKAAREFFDRANAYLADVYTMLYARIRKSSRAGACNLTSVLVLLTVVDALSLYVHPGRVLGSECTECGRGPRRDDAKKRFTQLLRDRLPWNSNWMEKGLAAAILYVEVRNLLVHELGTDRASRARPAGTSEPVCGRWGKIPTKQRRMDRLDSRRTWPEGWPVMEVKPSTVDPQKRVKICCAALYWAVKQMAAALLEDVRSGHLSVEARAATVAAGAAPRYVGSR